jgi:hypothetical protein
MSIYTKTTKKAKNCAQCGQEFIAFSERSLCCSKPCFDKFTSETRKEKRRLDFSPLPDKPCRQCGKIYTPKTKASNFCSDTCRQRAKYLANRSPEIITGKKMALRGRKQSEEHVAKRAASLAASLSSTKRKCVKCDEEFTPTLAAQKYCSGRCWQAVDRKKRPNRNRVSIPASQYSDLMLAQDGKCAICKCDSGTNNRGDRLAVDHCHSTGKIRGLLCHKCNTAIGLLKDSKENLLEAIRYLTKV